MKKSLTLLVLIGLVMLSLIYFRPSSTPQKIYNNKNGECGQIVNPRPENTNERMKWRQAQKGGQIDHSAVLKARKRIQKIYSKSKEELLQKDAGISGWFHRGPSNVGGRIRAIAFGKDKFNTDNIILIGAAGGGIWRSTNRGSTWSAVNDFLPNLAVTSIIRDPTDEDIFYAATGEGQAATTMGLPGAGIFKSTNKGLSWIQLNSTDNSDFLWVNKIAHHPTNSGVLYAVTTVADQNGGTSANDGKLFKSINGGSTWTLEDTNSNGPITDIEFHPNQPDTIVASGYGGAFVSYNGGASYTFRGTGYPGRMEVAMSKSNPAIMYALVDHLGYGLVFKSTDAGWNWTLVNNTITLFRSGPYSIGDYANTIWVDPLDEDNLLIGGLDVYRSTDGGVNFNRISDWEKYHDSDCLINNTSFQSLHADQHIIIEAPNYSALNKTVYFGNDGGIQRTSNYLTAGTTSGWQNLVNSTLSITQLYGASANNDGTLFAAATQDNGYLIGSNSSNWRQPSTGDATSIKIDPNDQMKIFANTNHNRLWRSTSGGLCFDTLFSLNDGADLIAPFVMDPDINGVIYLAGKRLWKYSDLGNFRIPIKDSLSNGVTITAIAAENNGQTIWVGYKNGVIEKTTDGGSNWSGDLSNASMPNNAMVTSIAMNPTFTSRVMVSFAGYRNDNIWYSSNSGFTWFNRSLGVDLQVNSLTYHPEQIPWVYAGTDLGVFASESNGALWSVSPLYNGDKDSHNNEGPLYTEVTDLFWMGDGTGINQYQLCAATFGRGLWTSNFILKDLYVNKNYQSAVQTGTMTNPYDDFRTAVDQAGNGTTIHFISNGDHDEVPTSILLDKRITVKETNGSVIIK